jgi:hypothetical protein
MVAALSTLSKLEDMRLFFRHPHADSDLEGPALSPLKRSVLPALNGLELRGDGGYLDDFVARVDVPSIDYLRIVFTNRPTFVINLVHLPHFIGRIEKFRTFDYAGFDLSRYALDVTLSLQRWTPGSRPETLLLNFLCDIDGPLPSLVEACNTSLLPLSNSNIKNFAIFTPNLYQGPLSGSNTDDLLWLEVLRRFSTAKRLLLSMDVVRPVAFALKQVIDEGITDVLPAIQELSVLRSLSAGPVLEAIEQFVVARGLSGFETPPFSRWQIGAQDTHEG